MRRILRTPREYIATLLVFFLLVSQTIHVSFFDSANASQEEYRDIVSIYVDETTYGRLDSEINRYAEDIQTSLGSTRVSLFVIDENTKPSYIANQNEKLYYEGDGEDDVVSRLVGTILIGNVPVPMVDTGEDQFPSMYPYTDFVDKEFLYDEETDTYKAYEREAPKVVEPEVWHGVINPAVGREFQPDFIEADPRVPDSVDIQSDIEKIRGFLDKTHDFYLQRGVFAPSTLPPRVFYYDGFYESKSFDIQQLGAYEVYMESAEELIYERFSKHFLRYVIGAVDAANKKFNQEEFEFIDTLGIEGTTSDMFPDAEIDTMPDIQTKPMVVQLLKKFHELINQKSLADIRGFVANAGRYNNGQEIRVDQPAVHVSAMDYSAMNTIRKANDKLEDWVDNVEIATPFSTFVMDFLTIKEPIPPPGLGITRHYDNFLFGRKGSTIFDPQFCTIARGSDYEEGPYKQGLLVEANGAFDVMRTPDSVKLYEKDGRKGIDCGPVDTEPSTYEVDSYWGKNIITNVNTQNWTFNEPSWTQDFYISIFSLSGMKEINQRGFEVEHTGPQITDANPKDCNAAYSPYPYMLQSGAIREDGPWPDDLGRSRDDISCLTVPEAWTQPTWGGEFNPPTRLLGMEWESHYLVGGEGQCANGMVAISVVGANLSGLIPPYMWACLPAFECPMPEKGKTHYQCIAPQITGYIYSLIPPESEAPPVVYPNCDATENKLFSRPCPYNAGNDQERYWTKIPNGADYRSPCITGLFIFNNAVVPNKRLNYPCFNLAMSAGTGSTEDSGGSSSGGGDSMSVTINAVSDYTTYETQSFHSIFDSRLYHKSPTLEEIAAAKNTAITPSMAIDHDRHVIFMEESPANKDKKIVYANLFRFDEEEILERHKNRITVNLSDARGQERIRKYGSGAIMITAYRLELDRLGKEQWEGSLPSTEPKFYPPAPSCWGGQLVDSPACVPATVDGPLSDEDIVAAIRANRWLHPDVTVKMQQAVETGLAYSHAYGSGGEFILEGLNQALLDVPAVIRSITGSLSSPPRIPIHTGAYDIAYLGLTHFIPQGDDSDSSTIAADGSVFADRATEYSTAREVINAYNLSEEDNKNLDSVTPSPSDACGPPEGVSLTEWPSAIMCWIKSLTPIRIVGQACGINTLGLPTDMLANALFAGDGTSMAGMSLSTPTPVHSATVPAMAAYYSGARMTYHLERNILLPDEAVQAQFLYSRGNTLFTMPTGASTRIDVVSITDGAGRPVNASERARYISIAPNPTTPTENGSVFMIRAGKSLGTVSLRATTSIPTTDGGTYTTQSDIFTIRITDEYLVATPTVDGRVSIEVPVTSASGMVFDFSVKNLSGTSMNVSYPIRLSIYDDISGGVVGTGITINANNYTLPREYLRTVGVYRLEFSDALGRHATQSIAVVPGGLARASFSPVSSAFIRESNTIVYLRLRDALGNPVTPDLYSVDLTADGGYFILADGSKRTTLHIDATESEIPLTVGSDVGGTVRLSAVIDGSVRSELDLRVFENARIIVSRVGTPRVGGEAIPVTVRVVDENNIPLSGFRSLVSLSTSPYGGTFSPAVVEITDGVSAPMQYIPGTLAGDHRITASVPGLGNVSDIIFSVLPGLAMYISHFEDDTTMRFSLRDRYNNIVPLSASGTLEIGGSPILPIAFSGGIYEMVKQTGYMTVTVPSLSENSLSYTDSTGPHTIRGIPSYTTFVKRLNKKFDFTEDYNARYTVLAGGSFLREGEDILYNTTPGSGQSLAVTTLLDTPYERETVFSVVPGGGLSVYDLEDVLPELTLTLDGGYPNVSAQDLVSNAMITQARYRTESPRLESCTGDACFVYENTDSNIRIEAANTGYTLSRGNTSLSLTEGTKSLVTVYEDGRITHLPGVTLTILPDLSTQALVLEVKSGFDIVGRIYYRTDARQTIMTGSIMDSTVRETVYIDDAFSVFAKEQFSHKKVADSIYGYRFMKRTMDPLYDEVKNGPIDIDSIGMTVNTPGIGWKDNNRTLLSYAGGDTVGEATRWFQSFTLINMGDPVAHVDKRAPGTEVDGVDRTLGEQLTSSRASPIRSYAHRDMDNDGFEDLVVLHADGFVEFLHNLGDRIARRGNIAYIPDISNRGFDVGDFTRDGYADLLGVDQEGALILLSNTRRQFTRMRIQISNGELAPVGVTQLKVRDMDNDTRDDIVYLTEGGELSILYGTTTPGIFDKRLLDPTLGITLSRTPIKTGGAIFMNSLPQVSLDSKSGTGATGIDEAIIWNEVYTPFLSREGIEELEADISDAETFASVEAEFDNTYSSPENSRAMTQRNFARIEYARAWNIDVSKTYSLGTGSILKSGEKVRVDIEIRNTGTTPLTGVEYIDTVPPIFSDTDTRAYTVVSGTETITREYARAPGSEYDNYFRLPDIAPGRSVILSYELTALPASYGELLVGDFEIGETGADVYGDVGFNTDTTCGADMLVWRSTAAREYERGTRTFSDPILGPDIAEKLQDADNNNVLDSIQDISQEEKQEIFDRVTNSPGVGGSPVTVSRDDRTVELGYDENAVDEMENMITDIYQTLGGCGRMKDGCLTFPINYAPLASGKDPVAFGYPIGDGFMVGEGVPMLSAVTRLPVGVSPYCGYMPFIWPLTAFKMEDPQQAICFDQIPVGLGLAAEAIVEGYAREAQATVTGLSNLSVTALLNGVDSITETASPDSATRIGAGGYAGIDSAANTIRIYATPTLTLGAGVGICFGGPARTYGGNPPPAIWPLSQMGNCLVVTDSLSMCKNDGTIADVDIRGTVGLGTINPTWNAGNGTNVPGSEACSIKARTAIETENQEFVNDVVDYITAPSPTKLPSLYNAFSQKTPRTTSSAGPLISLRGASEDSALMSVDITIDLAKPLTADNIINLKNKRIGGFPDFIMDWVWRQTDELVNSFFTLPRLKVIMPTSVGQNAHYNGSLTGTLESWGKSYSQVSTKNLSEKMGNSYEQEANSLGASRGLQRRTQSTTVNATSDLGRWMQETQNSFDATQDSAFQGELGKIADQGKGGIAAIRSAYKLIGNLPFISIREQDVAIDIPWVLPQELDRYSRSLDAYAREVNAAIANYCLNDPSPECANRQANINAGPLLASINENLKRIQEYKNLPLKIQKYITWKQRYLAQILCYIEEVQQMTTGWMKDNSIRFRKWAELIVLLRAIADGWQPLLDILADKEAYCSVCHNERYNAKYWKYKLISLLIPSLPVIKFPRWPDIILDLSDVRLGVVVAVPNFRPNLKPIRLPNIPSFSLPTLPGVSIGALDILPPLPPLPDLPELPAIPTIKLPNLPPPLKLPKILDELKLVLKILKLWKLLECYLNKTPFVPEWTLGDVIAQRTERYGYLPIDFIDVSLPQIAIPWTREIRVSSHVNYEIRSEFITEFARAAVAPLNEFTTDFGRSIPRSVGESVTIDAPSNINIDLQSYLDTESNGLEREIARLEREKDIYYDVDEFKNSFLTNLKSTPELAHLAVDVENALKKVAIESEQETTELLTKQTERYDMLRKYVELQYNETAELQNIVDLLTERHDLLTQTEFDRAQFVSDTKERASRNIAQKLQDTEQTEFELTESESRFYDLESVGEGLSRSVGRIAALSNDGSIGSTSNVAGGYNPTFQGIYIVTQSGYQTRLFDYIELLSEDAPSSRTDIDRDGDLDYLYVMDGALYLKRTSLRDPTKIIDTEIQTQDMSSDIPSAPDFFAEDVSLPNTLTFSYNPARPTEEIWRVELYDRYLEWDRSHLGDDTESPRDIIDIIKKEDKVDGQVDVLRSLARVENPDSLMIEGPRVEILTGSVDFLLSPGRTLYTGDSPATILYGSGNTTPTETKVIGAHRGYTFPESMSIRLERGQLYIVYPSIVPEQYTFSDELIGMPILPGMRLTDSDGEITLTDHARDEDIVIAPGANYNLETLREFAGGYPVQMDYPNGYYHAKIHNLDTRESVYAGESLLTPQLSSDTSAPDIDLRDTIRVPVYQTRSILLRDVITDTNDYRLTIDPDATQDTNGNGIYDDDFTTSGSTISITSEAITIGPYDTLGRRYMMLKVVDEFYNTTYLPVTVEIYSPIPTIETGTMTGGIDGRLSEPLQDQPIDLFRVRPSTDITPISSGAIFSQSGGVFDRDAYQTETGVLLSSSGSPGLLLSYLGLPLGSTAGYQTRVVLASDSNPLHVVLSDSAGRSLYRQYFALRRDATIRPRIGTTDTTTGALVLSPTYPYTLVSALATDPSIPGGYYLVDTNRRAVIAVARDGNIYPVSEGVTATYSERNGYPVISVRNTTTTLLELEYRFDFFYTAK